jgi:hypothetical protein
MKWIEDRRKYIYEIYHYFLNPWKKWIKLDIVHTCIGNTKAAQIVNLQNTNISSKIIVWYQIIGA